MKPFYVFLLAFFISSVYSAEGDVICPICKGEGVTICAVKNCIDGKVLCPGPCLKKEVGPWVKMKVDGHGPDELWKRFNNPVGGGWHAWTQAHIGQAIEVQNGIYVNTGNCKKCNGTTRIPCLKCKGQPVVCVICKGRKLLSKEEYSQYNIDLANKLDKEFPPIKLKDGSKINGKITMKMQDKILIKLPNGELKEIKTEDLAQEEIQGK